MFFKNCLGNAADSFFKNRKLFRIDGKRNHNFGQYRNTLLVYIACRSNNSGYLHFEDFGIGNSQAAATMSEHRVRFMKLFDPFLDICKADIERLSQFLLPFFIVRYEFMQRRID